MRIALVNWTRRKAGGVETYLSTVIPELYRAGHEVAFWHEVDVPAERDQISLPKNSLAWCVDQLGPDASLGALRDWRPDIIYSHKVEDPDLEEQTLEIAPAVYFAHDYQGMCISGHKTFKFPTVKPCERRFDRKCLVHYFPHSCGGQSPMTMLKLYRQQSKHLELLRKYQAIVTHSEHMLSELEQHGLSAKCVFRFPSPGHQIDRNGNERSNGSYGRADDVSSLKAHWHLLFSGRLEFLKGGQVFLDALPKVMCALNHPLKVTFAGNGQMRYKLERKARGLEKRHKNLRVEFRGWVSEEAVNTLLEECDLLVVPSLWPEPFGLVGPEAGLKNVPVAAFDVGGISDWLEDGVNGYLAPGNPPTADGLAQAIIKCLENPKVHARLARNAEPLASRFNIQNHLKALMTVFETVAAPARSKSVRAAAGF